MINLLSVSVRLARVLFWGMRATSAARSGAFPGRSLAALVLVAALSGFISGCKNPLYWVWPARKLFVSVTAARKIFELDRAGPRSTWAQVWLDSGPTRLEFAKKRGTLFALLPEARALAEISPDTYQVITTLSTQGKSSDLAISGDELWAYALNPEDRTVVRIDLRGARVERTISYADTDSPPTAIGSHPSKPDDLYVVTASGSVSVARAGLRGAVFSVGKTVKPARVVAGRKGELYVVDGGGTSLFRITDPDTPKVEAFDLLLLGGSCAAGADGTIYATAPTAHKVVRIGADQQRMPFAVGGQTPRAIAVDADGVYVANEGSNQVIIMRLKDGKLHEPEVLDSLPGPPADMVVVGD